MTISSKVKKSDLKNLNLAEESSSANLKADMEKYLGGDNDKLEGFYDDDEEI